MQIHGRGDLTFQERLDEELDYLENQSVTRDLRFLAETIPAIVRGRGAY
jgi:lipopolysaccharide/colanic/teichoic acid biosynthesis glycosyltransferase